MKRIELNIKCCADCPYMGVIGPNNDMSIGCNKINKKFGGGFAISEYTLYECPLPDVPDRLEQHHIKSSFKCKKCGSDTIVEDAGFRCLECNHLWIKSWPEHKCSDHKKYAAAGCTCCWSCKICGQLGGCDNQI